MPDQQFTRCPGCRTVFRVTPAQLELRNGQVRCGHCRTVFDGRARMISLAPVVAADSGAAADPLALGPPTMTLRSARALEPPAPEAAAASPREPSFEQTTRDTADHGAAPGRRDTRRRAVQGILAAAIPLLLLLLAGQAVFHYRDALAARWPGTKPALVRMCQIAGCAVAPLREIAGLSIDASDLQADPAHRGLLILTATLRNRAPVALAFPHLELTLTDVSDQVVVRRGLAPVEYAGGAADLAGGIPANGEVLVKLFIDASATRQAGYRLYLFYP